MKKTTELFQKIPYLLERLSSKPKVGGVVLTNAGIQYTFFEKAKPKTFFFRFPPGVMGQGRVKNKDQFIAVLRKLHEAIEPEKETKIIQIVASLPSELIYTQSFSVPNVGEEHLAESADLNLRMVSPMPSEKTYSGWQVIKKNPDRYELFGAFVDRGVVDEFRDIFSKAHFHVVVFEFPGLALAHLLQRNLTPLKKSTLLLYVSSDGLDISILRNNKLSFNYFRSWKSIQGEDNQISRSVFDTVVVSEIQKVLNFSSSKFKEVFDRAFIVAPGFDEEIKKLVAENFSFPANPLLFSPQSLSPAWYVAWGTFLRGEVNLGKDERINLNSETSAEIFFQEHLKGFVKLWRNVLILVSIFFLVVFGVASFFLKNHHIDLQDKIAASKAEVDAEELSFLYDQAGKFNALVDGIKSETDTSFIWSTFFDNFFVLADKSEITIKSIDVDGGGVRISAEAPDNTAALSFKNILVADEDLLDVDLPLFSITETAEKRVQFSVSFSIDKESFFSEEESTDSESL